MRPVLIKSRILLLLWVYTLYTDCSDTDSVTSDSVGTSSTIFKYLLYDVSAHEGFNLRRDVYMRLAVFIKHLNKGPIKWQLVLPSWNQLPHWKSQRAGNQRQLPWGLFFDLNSLRSYIPVIEAYEFFEDNRNVPLDQVFILQHYSDLWSENFTWDDKWDVEECRKPSKFRFSRTKPGMYTGSALGFHNIYAKNIQCVSFQGTAKLLNDIFGAFNVNFVLIEHAEIVLHDYYGSAEYWECRRSMKFSNDLINQARNFIQFTFNSTQETRVGDPYICVHFRRQDYVQSRPTQVPSVSFTAYQIKKKLEELDLNSVFVATDTTDDEFQDLRRKLFPFKTIRYEPSQAVLQKYKDGGVAIIEQIICSHARYFIGSIESTFSFRIQEERELLKMNPDTTFNRLCGDTEEHCQQPTRWRLVH